MVWFIFINYYFNFIATFHSMCDIIRLTYAHIQYHKMTVNCICNYYYFYLYVTTVKTRNFKIYLLL